MLCAYTTDGTRKDVTRVSCPMCHKVVSRRSARRHYLRKHTYAMDATDAADIADTTEANTGDAADAARIADTIDSADATRTTDTARTTDAAVDAVETGMPIFTPAKNDRKRKDSESGDFQAEDLVVPPKYPTKEMIQEIAGDGLFRGFLESMRSSSYQIVSKHPGAMDTFGVILSDRSAPLLAAAIKPGFTLEKTKATDAHLTPASEMDVIPDYDELTEEHLEVIEMGGVHGRERLIGSVIKTGAAWLQILCIESYSRNCLEDPHAEPPSLSPSSVPNNARTTQYRGRLKITVLYDGYGKPRLIIGVRQHNYLVTSADSNGTTVIGPTRCGQFPVHENSTFSIKDILGLAQARSHFRHRATYTARPTGLVGFSSLPQMPVTIFTIAQWNRNLAQAPVFYHLWRRSNEPGPGLILRLQDLNVLHETDTIPRTVP